MEKLLKKIYYLFNETDKMTRKDENNLELVTALIDEKIKLDTFKEVYQADNETKSLLESINQKILEIETRIIEEQQKFNDAPISENNLNIDILNDILGSLITLKSDILTGNNSYIKDYFINIKDLEEFEELIDDCIETLIKDNDELITFFGEPIAWYNSDNLESKYILNKEVIRKIYKILSTRRLHEGIKQNLPIKAKKIKIQNNIIYYRIILTHKERINKYFNLSQEIMILKKEIQALTEEKNKINGILCYNSILENSSNLFDKLFKRKKLKTLPTKVHIIDTVIESNNISGLLSKIEQTISERQNTLEELEISRENILDKACSSKLENIMETCNYNFREREKVRALINSSDEEIEAKINKLNEKLNKLPKYTGKQDVIDLITIDYDTCNNILSLEKSIPKNGNDCTPIISFYILKTLIECENIKMVNSTNSFYESYNIELKKIEYQDLIKEANKEFRRRLEDFSNINKILEERKLIYQSYQKYIEFLEKNQRNKSAYSKKRKYN